MEKAFGVFIQHWMKEENEMKEQKWREGLRARQNVACEKVLLNRRTIRAFRTIVETMLEMIGENMEEMEEYFDLCEMANRIAVDVIVNEEVLGVCDACHSGVVKFFVAENRTDMGAVCGHCDELHLYLNNIFEEN